MPEHPDILRLRDEYAKRAQQADESDRYSLFNPAQLFIIQQRQRQILSCLRRNGCYPLGGRQLLELGCGSGGVLLECLGYGATARSLHGTDLLFDRARAAQHTLCSVQVTCADGQSLPYAAQSFDLSMQFMAFSSILDGEVKANLARELLRVTRPTGMILWYDFWLNPANPQTRGIRPKEIKRLFPSCSYELNKITLAPPLVRRIAPLSWGLAMFLESLKVLNTHYLAVIRPRIQS